MVNLDNILEWKITKSFGIDRLLMSDGSVSYSSIFLSTSNGVIMISADIDTDQIDARILEGNFDTENHDIFTLDIIGTIYGYWTCNNHKGYFDVLLLSLGGVDPSVGFVAEASTISIVDISASSR